MNNLKGTLLVFALMLTITLSSAFLFSCGKNYDIKVATTGSGQVVEEKINKEKYYVANADDWHIFIGWYDGNRRYSENPKLKIGKNTPKKLEARFATTARLSFDRILNSFYNAYKDGLSQEGEYFNLKADAKYTFTNGDDLIENDLTFGGYLNFEGKGNQLFFKSKESDNFNIIFDEHNENGIVYIDNNGQKTSFDQIGMISNFLESLPKPSDESWSTKNILNSPTAFYQFEQYFGYTNAMGIVESVTNTNNNSSFVINFNKLLSTLKNNYPNFEDGSFLQKLANVLIGNYFDKSFPKISIKSEIEYFKDNNQQIKNLNIEFLLEQEYLLNFESGNLVIPKGKITISFDCIECGFSLSPYQFDEDLSTFPKPNQKLLNLHLAGDLSFISNEGDTENVKDIYRVELDADINPFALLPFNKNKLNYQDIIWDNLGFLNFRVVLVSATNETDIAEQYKNHKGETDYLNLVIDTQKYGANMLFYASLYDARTLFSNSYFFNNSYNLPELFSLSENESKDFSLKTKYQNEEFGYKISSLIKTLIDLCVNFDKNDLNTSIYNIIFKYFGENGLLSENLSLSDEGIVLKTENIRNFIREKEKDAGLTYLGYPIKTDRKIFGEDDICRLVLNFDSFQYGSVIKDADGNYIDISGNNIVGDYNKKHPTVMKIKQISALDDKLIDLDALSNLKGQVVEADQVILSDNQISQNYLSINGKYEKLKLKIINYQVQETDEDAVKIKFVLSIVAPDKNELNISFSEILAMMDIPYGLYVYETECKIG